MNGTFGGFVYNGVPYDGSTPDVAAVGRTVLAATGMPRGADASRSGGAIADDNVNDDDAAGTTGSESDGRARGVDPGWSLGRGR